MLDKVVSGGQTGVDRAALDAAMSAGLAIGGWCPKDRRALDGAIPPKYPLRETPGRSYHVRTLWNVRDSDATLIVCIHKPTGGTALTVRYCQQLSKPYYIHRLNGGKTPPVEAPGTAPAGPVGWIESLEPQVLNVAGPREEPDHPVYNRAYIFLLELFQLNRNFMPVSP